MISLRRPSLLFACALLGACTDGSASPGPVDAGPDARTLRVDGGLEPAPETTLHHAFPPIALAPGEERLSLCQAWTLNNETPIYVDSVTMDAAPGWHHSNWTWVPDTEFVGDDGTFPCRDRMYDSLQAVIVGGGVFFAQSTQATHEVQSFGAGAAYVIAPHARILGTVHVINTTAAAVSTGIEFTVHGRASSDVTTLLRGLALDNHGIALAPRTTTRVDMSCDLAAPARGATLEMRVHYVLPHFHGLATGFELFAVGGPSDGALIFGTSTSIGDPLGSTLAVPFDLSGATGLRMSCTYANPGDAAVSWGANLDDEMCVVLAYIDGPQELAGGSRGTPTTTTLPDGTVVETTSCLAVAL